jgi:hypothetical protein
VAGENHPALAAIAAEAVAVDGIESAAIFVARPGSSELELGAAAGIAGPPLDGLRVAVRNPAHPIARALTDPGPTFDVTPMAPGGPALRSHLPIVAPTTGARTVVGVLAVAHDMRLSAEARDRLERLAAAAGDAIGG